MNDQESKTLADLMRKENEVRSLHERRQQWLNNNYMWVLSPQDNRVHIRAQDGHFDTLCGKEVLVAQQSGLPYQPHATEMKPSKRCKLCGEEARTLVEQEITE